MFERLELLIGEKLEKLKNTCILIVGLGGVGGYAAESLTRSGIGHLIIVDNDSIDITNLNRQIISNQKNIGSLKVDEWEKRMLSINPNINITKINKFMTKENTYELFNLKPDYVIDACDTIEVKKEIIRICTFQKIPFISAMGMGKKIHPEYLEITDIRKTSYDPVAKIIRKMVNDEHIKSKVMVVYSKEGPIKNNSKNIPSCAFVPSCAGLLCASYIFNLIIGE